MDGRGSGVSHMLRPERYADPTMVRPQFIPIPLSIPPSPSTLSRLTPLYSTKSALFSLSIQLSIFLPSVAAVLRMCGFWKHRIPGFLGAVN